MVKAGKGDVLKRYRVIIYFGEVYEVDAGDEQEVQDKADTDLKNFNDIPIPDEYEVECLDEDS